MWYEISVLVCAIGHIVRQIAYGESASSAILASQSNEADMVSPVSRGQAQVQILAHDNMPQRC